MKLTRYGLLEFGIPISIVFSNTFIFSLIGAKVQLSHIIVLLMILTLILSKSRVKCEPMIVAAILMVLPLAPLYRINDYMEFFKSYVMYLTILFLVFIYFNSIKNEPDVLKRVLKNFCIVMFCMEIYGIIQFALVNIAGIETLYNVFGNHQFLTQIETQFWGIRRASSLFYEPSIFGVMCDLEFMCLLILKKINIIKKKYYYLFIAICVAAVGVSISTSAYIMMLIILILDLALNKDILDKNRCLIIASLVITMIVLTFSGDSILIKTIGRIKMINVEGYSTYERLSVPVQLLNRTMSIYPLFGRGLGQEGNVDAVGQIGSYSSPQNSLVAIGVTFGLSSILVIFVIAKYFRKIINKDRRGIIIL